MARWFLLLVVLLVPICADAILGDLNNDGTVDFSDFFIFADNFGKRGPPSPQEQTATSITFRYEFADYSYLEDWFENPIGDDWYISEGWLLFWGKTDRKIVGVGPSIDFTTDIEVSVDTEWITGTDHVYGIRFLNGADGGAYGFGISAQGEYVVWKWDALGVHDLIAWTSSSAINTWGLNALRVRTEGSLFLFYVNDIKVDEVRDYSFYQRKVRLFVGEYVGNTQKIRFDNLRIRTTPRQITENTVVVHDTIMVPTGDYAIESRIDGDFNGWDGETIFNLANGQIWQQSQYAYTYHYAYRPEVVIYRSPNGYKMKVEGVDGYVFVERTK